jgi:hypothetical protein
MENRRKRDVKRVRRTSLVETILNEGGTSRLREEKTRLKV